VPLSAWVQVPQLVWFATPSFLFKFVCGLMLLFQWTPGLTAFRGGFEVASWLGRNPGPETQLFVINFFPLFALRGLWRLQRGEEKADNAPPGGDVVAQESSGGRAAQKLFRNAKS
jgi:hypothetical protein